MNLSSRLAQRHMGKYFGFLLIISLILDTLLEILIRLSNGKDYLFPMRRIHVGSYYGL